MSVCMHVNLLNGRYILYQKRSEDAFPQATADVIHLQMSFMKFSTRLLRSSESATKVLLSKLRAVSAMLRLLASDCVKQTTHSVDKSFCSQNY